MSTPTTTAAGDAPSRSTGKAAPAAPASTTWAYVEKVAAVVVIFILAVAVRLATTMRGSGLYGIGNYDDSVHYAAAVGLVHGLLPYRDFLLLHPPGIVVALAPFAALGRWIGDPDAFAVARVAFMALGGVNALLVYRFLRPVGAYAAWLGGLFYALFWPAVYSEHLTLLEGLASTGLLAGLVLLAPKPGQVSGAKSGTSAMPGTVRLLVAGAALGAGASIKIWGVVPVVVLTVLLVFTLGLRRSLTFLAGAVAAVTAVCLPFFASAPAAMWRMVVADQLGRNDVGLHLYERLLDICGLTLYKLPERPTLLLGFALALLAAATVTAIVQPRTRPAAVLVVALTALLLSTPSWFQHYAALTAPVLAICVGGSGQMLLRAPGVRRSTAVRVAGGVLLLVGLGVGSVPVATATLGSPFPGHSLAAAVADRPGCVTTDQPNTLIEMDVLHRNLTRGCPLVVDLGGASYHLDSPDRGVSARKDNEVWQGYALQYLSSGDTTIIIRFRKNYGFSAATDREVRTWPGLVTVDKFHLRQPPH